MGLKHSGQYTSEGMVSNKKEREVHPIWRGVGIFLIVLLPALGYLAAMLIIRSNQTHPWFGIPPQLIVPGKDPLLLVKVLLAIGIGAFIYFILMLITFIVYRFFGPETLGPLDVPPVNWGRRK